MLPKWHEEWEPRDPLKGRRGWQRRHYVGIGFVVLCLLTAFGLGVVVNLRARAHQDWLLRQLKEPIALTGEGPTAP